MDIPKSNSFTSDAALSPSARNALSMFFDRSIASLSLDALTAQPILIRFDLYFFFYLFININLFFWSSLVVLQYFFFGSKLGFGFFRSQIFRICCQFETLTHTFINYTAHSIEVKTQQYTNGSLSRLIGSQITQKILCFYDTCCTTKFSKFNEIKFTSIFYLDSI